MIIFCMGKPIGDGLDYTSGKRAWGCFYELYDCFADLTGFVATLPQSDWWVG